METAAAAAIPLAAASCDDSCILDAETLTSAAELEDAASVEPSKIEAAAAAVVETCS